MQMVIKLSSIITLIITILRGEIQMVDMYLALVIAGRRTCDPTNASVKQVPDKYRVAVIKELTALGLDANGDPIE